MVWGLGDLSSEVGRVVEARLEANWYLEGVRARNWERGVVRGSNTFHSIMLVFCHPGVRVHTLRVQSPYIEGANAGIYPPLFLRILYSSIIQPLPSPSPNPYSHIPSHPSKLHHPHSRPRFPRRHRRPRRRIPGHTPCCARHERSGMKGLLVFKDSRGSDEISLMWLSGSRGREKGSKDH